MALEAIVPSMPEDKIYRPLGACSIQKALVSLSNLSFMLISKCFVLFIVSEPFYCSRCLSLVHIWHTHRYCRVSDTRIYFVLKNMYDFFFQIISSFFCPLAPPK